MKKIIIAAMVIVGLSATASANKLDNALMSQCEYLLYNKGQKNVALLTYMNGMVVGQQYKVPLEHSTDYSRTVNATKIISRACNEALLDKTDNAFIEKFQWGISISTDKRFSKNANTMIYTGKK